VVQDDTNRRLVEGDACNISFDDVCTLAYMTLSVIRSIRISSTDFSTALRSPNIHTCNQITRVGESTLKVIEPMVRSRQYNVV
jgi:hypothetical protein